MSKLNKKFILVIPICLLFCTGIVFVHSVRGEELTSIQHAARLSAIEKRLLACDIEMVENLSAEEQDWYCKFQEGIVFFDGWQEISDDVVAKVPDEEKVKIKFTMQSLGIKIGCEWSKDNDVRRISTDMLKDWGKELRQAADDKSTREVILAIQSIEYEVDELLAFNE